MKTSDKELKSKKQAFTRSSLIFFTLFCWLFAVLVVNVFVSLGLHNYRILAGGIAFGFATLVLIFGVIFLSLEKNRANKISIRFAFGYKLYKFTDFLYSPKTQTEVFKPIISDWDEEYFKALIKKEIWKTRWINVRYTYAFLAAMFQKSPIGDLIELIGKLRK